MHIKCSSFFYLVLILVQDSDIPKLIKKDWEWSFETMNEDRFKRKQLLSVSGYIIHQKYLNTEWLPFFKHSFLHKAVDFGAFFHPEGHFHALKTAWWNRVHSQTPFPHTYGPYALHSALYFPVRGHLGSNIQYGLLLHIIRHYSVLTGIIIHIIIIIIF